MFCFLLLLIIYVLSTFLFILNVSILRFWAREKSWIFIKDTAASLYLMTSSSAFCLMRQ